ncbi:MAG: hypothetical protein CFE23_16005 [Flavobacterium sp. BFFFF1]|uniref:hypothetical protein n=1 Tax=Flavobacterium sp. BFFFF1 TaxID=2015557 RepID=UPI000BDD71F5|nr:hypothetical protein [Flavobacterium sp. BFFFF1]OYU79014.1 MAG: hypothetical protein CFE23_16005 [Flavobacterium sp. BFFFF1]
MKNCIPFLLLAIFLSCSKTASNKTVKTIDHKQALPFFEFDYAEHWRLNPLKENEFDGQSIKENKNEADIQRHRDLRNIFSGHSPEKLNDDKFFTVLSEYYTLNNLDKSRVNKLKKILTDRQYDLLYTSACMPMYRDVLILKKADSVIGIVKICFECQQIYFLGNRINTKNFGTNKDYNNLWKTLHP